MTIERRFLALDGLAVEQRDDGVRRIVGHAAIFNSLSEDLGGFREKIAPGAFAEAIGRDDVRALWNHDANFVLGRVRAGTLTMREDERGLAVEIDPPDTQWARDLLVSMARGDVTQMSFGFRVERGGQSWEKTDEGNVRTITRASLFDVSPVTYPAYADTDVAVRSLAQWQAESAPAPEKNSAPLRRRLALAERNEMTG
jgi:HK97 family phage prohead protease